MTGRGIFLGNIPVSWKTKKQSTVSRSTTEAEYRSIAAMVSELQWIFYILQDFNLNIPTPIHLHCDNQVALHFVANPVFHERTKHLDIDCHFVKDKVKDGFISLQHTSSQQIAYQFTKALSGPSFQRLLSKLNLIDCYQVQFEGG